LIVMLVGQRSRALVFPFLLQVLENRAIDRKIFDRAEPVETAGPHLLAEPRLEECEPRVGAENAVDVPVVSRNFEERGETLENLVRRERLNLSIHVPLLFSFWKLLSLTS